MSGHGFLIRQDYVSVRLCVFDADSLFQIRLIGFLTTCSEFVVSSSLP